MVERRRTRRTRVRRIASSIDRHYWHYRSPRPHDLGPHEFLYDSEAHPVRSASGWRSALINSIGSFGGFVGSLSGGRSPEQDGLVRAGHDWHGRGIANRYCPLGVDPHFHA